MTHSPDVEPSTGSGRVQQDHGLRYLPLRRASADGSRARGPLTPLPENLGPEASEAERHMARGCWAGVELDAAGLAGVMAAGWDVGVLAAASGLVIVDCDVKTYDADGWVVTGGTAVRAQAVVKHGIDDLRREVERMGHTMAELATYTVRTKSGGYHLYYRTNPEYPLTTRHHRQDWRVDVIASPNSWVAAPPTEGYQVVRNGAVAQLPDWLAVFLYGVNASLPPLGARVAAVAGAVGSGPGGGPVRPGESLLARHRRMLLEEVALANLAGGWNSAIYRVARGLLDAGYDERDVREAVMGAAAPADEREERKADATITSALRGYQRDGHGGGAG
jgi:hypothetical protein